MYNFMMLKKVCPDLYLQYSKKICNLSAKYIFPIFKMFFFFFYKIVCTLTQTGSQFIVGGKGFADTLFSFFCIQQVCNFFAHTL